MMRRYNIVSRIILFLTVITFALAAPVLVQEKHQACVDVVHVPENVITVLEKRILYKDLDMLWDSLWHYGNVWRNRNPAGVHPHEPVPPSSLGSSTESDLDSDRWSTISNAPSAESQSENFKAAEYGVILTKGKEKVSSGTATGVDSDTVNVAQMSAVDIGPSRNLGPANQMDF